MKRDKRDRRKPTAAAAAAPPAAAAPSAWRRRWLPAVLALVLIAALAGLAWRHRHAADASAAPAAAIAANAAASAAQSAAASYVDNRQCLACHAAEAASWQASHHAQAMAVPTAASVRGNFADATFVRRGVVSRFFRRGDKYLVHTEGADGRPADFEIAYTFGVAPLQQYLIAQPGGRLQALQIAWDSERKRWFDLRPQERTPPGDVLHWTGRYETANTMCITCHTTAYEKRYDAAADRYDSRWQDLGVGCQACHGPGSAHLQWAQQAAQGRGAPDAAGARHGWAMDPKTLGSRSVVDLCAPCHSRRSELTATAAPGAPRLDQSLPSLLTAGLYHADGQQLDEVFVDGSFRQSRMFARGVGCSHCHDPHSGRIRRQGNALCLQCHRTPANAAFPGAAGVFDASSHHHHAPGSAGAQCVNCHMPAKVYMQIQSRPDHSLRIPRPDLTLKIGTPNACNGCHADKTAQWAADRVQAWYGARRRQETHYGEALAVARAGRPDAGAALDRLVANPQVPAIVRATALAMPRGDADAAARIAATRDADAEVRAAAADSLDALPAEQRLTALAPLLTDPLRAVRIAAARGLSSLPAARIDAATRPAFEAALAEFIAVQKLSLDMPGARLNLAVVEQNLGHDEAAASNYLAALAIDPDFTPARADLALLYNAMSRNADALRVLREGLARHPEIGELQYSLGLLLAEEHRLDEAAAALGRAAQLMPTHARVHYNLGLALQQLGRHGPARAALLQAQRLEPRDPEPAQALAMLALQDGQLAQAGDWARRWSALAPDDPRPRQLLERLGSAAAPTAASR
ncbi:MAG: tetratricopeptide repeat protein [Burkholderiales bacterium]|nr:tetratricopeptide repeat protein [Burkholderiales bacterium]